MDLTIVLAQFGERCGNFEPGLSSYRKHFPDAQFVLYTDTKQDALRDFDAVVVVDPPFNKGHPRYGYRCNDYYKVFGLLQSQCGIAISIDSDTQIVSDRVKHILALTDKFGVCVPANPRLLVGIDTQIGTDSDGVLDESGGCGYAMNMTPITYRKTGAGSAANADSERLLKTYIGIMESAPVRGPLAMWRAAWQTGFQPYLLPPQWCVCQSDCGIGNEIILHTGHERVGEYYGLA